MKSRDNSVRIKRFQLEEKRRQIGQIEAMIEEFRRMVSDLDMEIAAEHRRTGIDDQKHFAYSTFARAARQRRENLQNSINDLQGQLEAAEARFKTAAEELRTEEDRLERDSAGEADRAVG